jgi:hypothetical protein
LNPSRLICYHENYLNPADRVSGIRSPNHKGETRETASGGVSSKYGSYYQSGYLKKDLLVILLRAMKGQQKLALA